MTLLAEAEPRKCKKNYDLWWLHCLSLYNISSTLPTPLRCSRPMTHVTYVLLVNTPESAEHYRYIMNLLFAERTLEQGQEVREDVGRMHRVSSIHCILSAIFSGRNMSRFVFCSSFRHSEKISTAQLTMNTQSTHAQCTSNMRTMSINMLYTTQSLRFIIVIIIMILNSSCLWSSAKLFVPHLSSASILNANIFG